MWSLNKRPFISRSTHVNLNSTELHYPPFIATLVRCERSCNTFDDPFGRICDPSKTGGANLKVFIIISGTNESKTSMKNILYFM